MKTLTIRGFSFTGFFMSAIVAFSQSSMTSLDCSKLSEAKWAFEDSSMVFRDYDIQCFYGLKDIFIEASTSKFPQEIDVSGNWIKFKSRVILSNISCDGGLPFLSFAKGLRIHKSFFPRGLSFDKLNVKKRSKNVENVIEYNTIVEAEFNELKGDQLFVRNNRFTDSLNTSANDLLPAEKRVYYPLVLKNATTNSFAFYYNDVSYDKSVLQIENSRFRDKLVIGNNQFGSYVKSEFMTDTIDSYFAYDNNKGKIQSLIFSDCHIDGTFSIENFWGNGSISLKFINCSFGQRTILNDLDVDSIFFINCVKIAEPIPLSTSKPYKTKLVITNSKIENIMFDYSEKIELVPDSETNSESRTSMYETLIQKFRKEGRLKSVKNLDIEYKEYIYRNEVAMGWLLGFIDWAWWNYGYSKYLIIWWTIGWLIIFTRYNYSKWIEMHSVYGLKQSSSDKVGVEKSWSNVFFYTSLIFFTLRIDFDRLDFRNTRYVYVFFFQYVIGLICMFFIFNAILKFD